MAYILGLAVVIAIIIGIVKAASGDRYAKMTEEEFEAKIKRGSRIGGALLEVQKLANPSLKVECLHQQEKRVEAKEAESGDGDTAGSLQGKSSKTPWSKMRSRDA